MPRHRSGQDRSDSAKQQERCGHGVEESNPLATDQGQSPEDHAQNQQRDSKVDNLRMQRSHHRGILTAGALPNGPIPDTAGRPMTLSD